MTRGRLEALGLLEREITPCFSTYLKGWVFLFRHGVVGRVVAWSRLVGLLFLLGAVRRMGAHGVRWQILASELLRSVISWAGHLELFELITRRRSETELRGSLLQRLSILLVVSRAW